MLVADIHSKVDRLPLHLQQEVLDFVEFLLIRHHIPSLQNDAEPPLDAALVQMLLSRRDAVMAGTAETIPSDIVKKEISERLEAAKFKR
jgi:Protein of unknown function (DUF2281)